MRKIQWLTARSLWNVQRLKLSLFIHLVLRRFIAICSVQVEHLLKPKHLFIQILKSENSYFQHSLFWRQNIDFLSTLTNEPAGTLSHKNCMLSFVSIYLYTKSLQSDFMGLLHSLKTTFSSCFFDCLLLLKLRVRILFSMNILAAKWNF